MNHSNYLKINKFIKIGPKSINSLQKVNKLIKVAWVCASIVRWPTTVAGPKA